MQYSEFNIFVPLELYYISLFDYIFKRCASLSLVKLKAMGSEFLRMGFVKLIGFLIGKIAKKINK